MSKDSLAPCFVQDVNEMKECEVKSADFFWLGRIPCRTVRLVGLLVGVQIYEKRTIYYLDDGTGVVECVFRHPTPPKSPSKAPSKRPKPSGSSKNPTGKIVSTPVIMTLDLNPPPKPLASVGMSIRVIGRVTVQRQSRIIITDSIEPCISINEESQHWLNVCDLHRSHYFPPNSNPFVIPQLPPKPSNSTNPQAGPSSTIFNHTTITFPPPQTPSKFSVCSSAATSPSLASSPVGPKSPLRLRHPSRLHTRDLTANTFRIYVKHYLDNAQTVDSNDDSDFEDPDPDITFSLSQIPNTPTRPRKRPPPSDSGETPRPAKRRSIGTTPKGASSQTPTTALKADATTNPDDGLYGFTISHLRRVPELALLARRVVEAEAKRRAREERKKAKEQQAQGLSTNTTDTKGKSRATPSSAAPLGSTKPGEGPGPKMKRLFRFAIRQLYDEGSIVLFDGPKHRLPHISLSHSQSEIRLWKSSMSTSIDANSTTVSSVTNQSYSFTGADPDPSILSDPDSNEESYIPLVPSYLCGQVEKAIVSMVSRARKMRERKTSVPGPTADEIVHYLRRRDDRWARVGEWHVKAALEWGQENGRMWCVGKDRWEVCQ
ncbi:hypothetical protein QCA50_019350 [Cerrena zonata]|uniref:CST complex subunit STN1 n=1 Tax=Cerrena zonata TaxID=2478898 RepID=A0AAW0FFH5_9APHY